jgi:hypothetical protein
MMNTLLERRARPDIGNLSTECAAWGLRKPGFVPRTGEMSHLMAIQSCMNWVLIITFSYGKSPFLVGK